jgi:hypothetical protein
MLQVVVIRATWNPEFAFLEIDLSLKFIFEVHTEGFLIIIEGII